MSNTRPPNSSSLDLALLRGAIEEMPLGVATTRGGSILYANAALERLYGASPGELDMRPVEALFDGDTLAHVRAELDAQRVFDGRIRARALDGSVITVELHAERYHSGSGAMGGFVLARDATLELGALGRLVDMLGAAIFRVRIADGCVEEVSPAIEGLIGVSVGACVADSSRLPTLVDGGDRDRLASIYRRIARGDAATASAEVSVRKPDGARVTIAIHATGRRDAGGNVRHVDGVVSVAGARAAPTETPIPTTSSGEAESKALLVVSGNLLREVGYLTHAGTTTARRVRGAAASLRNAPQATVDELTLASDNLLRALSAASALNRRVRRALSGRVTRGAMIDVLENVRSSLAPLIGEHAISLDAGNSGHSALETRLDTLTLALTQLGLRAFRLAGGGSLGLEAQREGNDVSIVIHGEPGGENTLAGSEPDAGSIPLMMAPADLEAELRAVATLLAPMGGTVDEDVSLDGARTRVRLRVG